jgi:3-keto-disaccharide hydrolase
MRHARQAPDPARGPNRRIVLKSIGATGLAAAAGPLLPSRASAATPTPSDVTFDWSNAARPLTTTATLQLVVNPLIRRGSPIHDNVFNELQALGAEYVRFVPWKPYPLLGVAELYPPENGETSWDFSLIDPLVEDFEAATRGHKPILNFSTIPQWMWQSPWSVRDGQLYANGGSNGVARTGTDWTDYTFTVDVTPIASATHNGSPYAQSGMLFRMDSTGGNGYGFLISNYPYSSPAASGYVVSVPFSGGSAGKVQAKPLPFAIVGGQTYHVTITVSGSTYTIAVNGTTVDSFTDSTYPQGTVGFREYSAESGEFGNVTVTAPDGTVLLSDDFSNGLNQWAGPGLPPSDPDVVDSNYSQGTQLAVPIQTVADYYRRLVAWYTQGGFTDEYGVLHESGYHYALPYWEVLNELEHSLSPQLYTQLYDAIVTEIQKVAPHTKFVGLAQATPGNATAATYFLNPANHAPGVPLDMLSYHFYAHSTAADTPETYGNTGFPSADAFFEVVDQIEAARMKYAPQVRTTIDEVGTILDTAATQADPAEIPDEYWNYSGAIYAYVFGNLAMKGIDVIGESQLVGYPGQYPSVSMVDWTTGLPNARYRVLQLILEQLRPDAGLVSPSGGQSDDYYVLGLNATDGRRVLVVNKTDSDIAVAMDGVRNAVARVVDQTSAGGPIRTEHVRADQFMLGGYGVAVLTLAS